VETPNWMVDSSMGDTWRILHLPLPAGHM